MLAYRFIWTSTTQICCYAWKVLHAIEYWQVTYIDNLSLGNPELRYSWTKYYQDLDLFKLEHQLLWSCIINKCALGLGDFASGMKLAPNQSYVAHNKSRAKFRGGRHIWSRHETGWGFCKASISKPLTSSSNYRHENNAKLHYELVILELDVHSSSTNNGTKSQLKEFILTISLQLFPCLQQWNLFLRFYSLCKICRQNITFSTANHSQFLSVAGNGNTGIAHTVEE